MKPVDSIYKTIYKRKKLRIFIKTVWTLCNDVLLNIKSMPHLFSIRKLSMDELLRSSQKSVESRHNDSAGYESPDYWNLRKIVKIVKPGHCDVVYDLGSGMGRVVCLFARRKVRRCVGIEIFEPLCMIARKNAVNLWGRKAPINIVCEDAAKADITDGTIYFMFNPFGSNTLRDVLVNIKRSLVSNPRKIIIVYYNAVHEDILRECEWLQMFYLFYTTTCQPISFWKNIDF